MAKIVLATLNARYIHSSLGLRCLMANMGELQEHTLLREFTINQRAQDIAEELLALEPEIIGLGVYIWNVEETARLVGILRRVRPDIHIVLGGPEVSHEWDEQELTSRADYLITGMADLRFAELCRLILAGAAPAEEIIHAAPPNLETLALPYRWYSNEDIANRVLYVEASRGCPFKCEFCLSALDKTATPFPLDAFLEEMAALHERGARRFKFVDRTFNLKIGHSLKILEFFLQRLDKDLFLHFELIPDRLPDPLKKMLGRFPPGTLQFEIGVQTLNPEVQTLISRRQDNQKTRENLRWIRAETHAHIHADLIIGLPGEDLESFARGFDELVALSPHEIQVGILKRLRGSPIRRHTDPFRMAYNPFPPYDILSTDRVDYALMQRLHRFARYWDLIANSGRFRKVLPMLLGDQPFARFLRLSDWLYHTTHQTHRIGLERLFDLIHRWLTEELSLTEGIVGKALCDDYARAGLRAVPAFVTADLRDTLRRGKKERSMGSVPSRQDRHLC